MSNMLRKIQRRMAQDFSFRVRSHANFQKGCGQEKRAFWKHVWKALSKPKPTEPVVSPSVAEQVMAYEASPSVPIDLPGETPE